MSARKRRKPEAKNRFLSAQKDLKKLQQREQRILKKLAEAREAQANAMSRFIQARARVMQAEARLQSMHAGLASAQTSPDQPSEPTDPASNSGISKPDATLAAQVIIPHIKSSYTPVQATDPLTNASSTIDGQTQPPVKQFRTPVINPSLISEQAANNLETFTRAPDNTISVPIDEEEDEEETKKMPALRPVRSASPAQRNPGAEEMANTTLATPSQSERSDQTSTSNETREAGATDITAKIPIMRQDHDQTQEPL